MTDSSLLKMENIVKRFGNATVVNQVSIEVKPGKILALLGENGAGKSTLIKILAGVYKGDGGRILFHDREIASAAALRTGFEQPIAFIHQDLGLIDWMTVAENMAFTMGFPRRFGLVDWKAVRSRAQTALREVGIDLDPDARVFELSRTEKALLAIARAVAVEAEVLVLDEPTVGLDPRQTAEFRDTLKKLSGGRTVIFSSPILSEVQALCDRVIILHHGRVACDQRLGDMSRGAGARLQAAIFGDMETLLPALRSLNSVARVTRLPAREAGVAEVLIEGKPGAVPQKELFTLICGLQMPLMRLTPAADTLEDVFLRCTADDQALEKK